MHYEYIMNMKPFSRNPLSAPAPNECHVNCELNQCCSSFVELRKGIFICKFSGGFCGNETLANLQNHSAVYWCWQSMHLSQMLVSNIIRKNKILAKISEFALSNIQCLFAMAGEVNATNTRGINLGSCHILISACI